LGSRAALWTPRHNELKDSPLRLTTQECVHGVVVLGTMLVRSALGALLLGLSLFLPAGRLDWPQAWWFIVLFIGCSLAIGFWLLKAHPDLLAARMRSPLSGNQKAADRIVGAALIATFWGWCVLMGFDARFGWSAVPAWGQGLGAALIVIAFYGWYRVLAANAFAATTIEVQSDRGQSVVSSGPYAVVRHPMYAFALLLFIGTPLLLGSFWGLAGLVLLVPVLMMRTVGKETLLREGLPGYRAYADRVRFRLVPGVW